MGDLGLDGSKNTTAKLCAIFLFEQAGEAWVENLKPHIDDNIFEGKGKFFICLWNGTMMGYASSPCEQDVLDVFRSLIRFKFDVGEIQDSVCQTPLTEVELRTIVLREMI